MPKIVEDINLESEFNLLLGDMEQGGHKIGSDDRRLKEGVQKLNESDDY